MYDLAETYGLRRVSSQGDSGSDRSSSGIKSISICRWSNLLWRRRSSKLPMILPRTPPTSDTGGGTNLTAVILFCYQFFVLESFRSFIISLHLLFSWRNEKATFKEKIIQTATEKVGWKEKKIVL